MNGFAAIVAGRAPGHVVEDLLDDATRVMARGFELSLLGTSDTIYDQRIAIQLAVTR